MPRPTFGRGIFFSISPMTDETRLDGARRARAHRGDTICPGGRSVAWPGAPEHRDARAQQGPDRGKRHGVSVSQPRS